MGKDRVFKVFPSFEEIQVYTEAGADADIKVTVKGEGETRLLIFDKPVRTIELNSLETLKIAFALLGRIGICEICGKPFRRKGATWPHVDRRFCSRECFFEYCKRTGFPGRQSPMSKLFQATFHPERLKDKANIIEIE